MAKNKPSAKDDDDNPNADDNDNDDSSSGSGDEPLGDSGKRALNRERAARRKAEQDLKDAREELKEVRADQDASKSDMEKVLAKVDGLEKRAVEAERKALVAEVSTAKGLSPAQAKRLQGSTRDELEADADELLDAFTPAAGKNGDGDGDDDTGKSDDKGKDDDGKPASDGKSVGRPKEKLSGGASPPDQGDEVDPAKLAESILDSPF